MPCAWKDHVIFQQNLSTPKSRVFVVLDVKQNVANRNIGVPQVRKYADYRTMNVKIFFVLLLMNNIEFEKRIIHPIWFAHTAISIKVVHEQSGKVEYERERLLGIANKLINFQSGSQQPFALVFDFSALLVDNLN
jgi:hypothetical protein